MGNIVPQITTVEIHNPPRGKKSEKDKDSKSDQSKSIISRSQKEEKKKKKILDKTS